MNSNALLLRHIGQNLQHQISHKAAVKAVLAVISAEQRHIKYHNEAFQRLSDILPPTLNLAVIAP